MVDIQQRSLRPFEHHLLARANGLVQQYRGIGDERRYLLRRSRILLVDCLRVQGLGAKQCLRDGVLLVAGVVDVGAQQCRIQQVDHAQPAAVHLVLVRWPNAAAGGPNLGPPRRILRRQLDHAVVGQDYLRPVRHEELAINLQPGVLQLLYLAQEGHRIQHHAVADDAPALRPQHPAGDQLQHELLAGNDDGVAGVVPAGIARHHGKLLRQHIDDLALALVAPLRAKDHR